MMQPRGIRNLNPGNIEDGPFARGLPGYVGSDGRFAVFDSMDAGVNAIDRLLESYGRRGFNTPNAIIGRWAPAADGNPVASYARFVAAGADPNAPLDMANPAIRRDVAARIAQFETGQRVIPTGARAAIQAAAPMQPPQGQNGTMAFSDDDLIRILTGQGAAPAPAQKANAAPAAAPVGAHPPAMAGLPIWAVPASQQGAAGDPGGMSDEDLLRLIGGGSAQEPAKPARPSVPASGGGVGSDLVRMAQTGDTMGAKLGRAGIGIVRGIGDVADTMAQGIAAAGDAGANALMRAGVIAPETAQAVTDWRGRVGAEIEADRAAWDQGLGDSTAAGIGRIGGNIAGTAIPAGGAMRAAGAVMAPGRNLLMQAARGGAQGAAAGATGAGLTSAASEAPVLEQMRMGALTGGALGAAGPAITAAARGATNAIMGSSIGQETAKLAKAARDKFGIPITAGSISESPAVNVLEGVLKKLPLSGYTRLAGEQRAAFNRAVASEFGENADKITPDVLAAARKRIGAEYDAVEQAVTLNVDRQLATDLTKISGKFRDLMDDGEWKRFTRTVNTALKDYAKTGTMTGAQYQALKNTGSPLQILAKSNNTEIANAAREVLAAMRDNMVRSAPADMAKRYATADKHWAVMKTIEPMVGKAATGDISPQLLRGAIGATEIAQGKGGQLAELAQIGQRFLKEAPSSFTSERAWTQNALQAIGGGAVGAYGAFNPDQAALGAAGLGATLLAGRGAGAILRSDRLANRMINNALAQQPARGGNRLLEFGAVPSGAVFANRPEGDRKRARSAD